MIDQFSCTVVRERPEAIVRVRGALNLDTATTIRHTLLKCLANQPTLVVIDLAAARVADDLAVALFPAIDRHAAAWPGCDVILAAPSPEVDEALKTTAVCRYVKICPTVEDALRPDRPTPTYRRRSTPLLPIPSSATEARWFVDEICRSWGVEKLSGPAQLVATELVSNSIRHARTAIELMVSLRSRYLHIAVRDRSVVLPRRRAADLHGEGGRGLLVVEALSTAWGSSPTDDGKVVWATLKRRDAAVR
jgi:anti-anti-sigma regulatory factor/anti-sigma regulatory factor (Ser/Thr protein kinase)